MTLDELATFVASACSLTVGTDLFKGHLPDDPDACAALLEYPGSRPTMLFGQSAIALEYPRVQCVFRGDAGDYATPRATAETAYRAMAAASAQSISSTRYLAMEPMQSPFSMGRDSKSRVRVAFNVRLTKGLSA